MPKVVFQLTYRQDRFKLRRQVGIWLICLGCKLFGGTYKALEISSEEPVV